VPYTDNLSPRPAELIAADLGTEEPARWVTFLLQTAFALLFALLSPIYYLNKWDFKRGTKRNPFYTSRLVRLLERYPILYEVAMLAQNFPVPHHVYKVLPKLSGDVLQVGCGTGLLNKFMRRKTDIQFTNLDPNSHALELGMKLKRFSTCVQGAIDKGTSLPAESFDVVLFARSFHHVRHHRKAFAECARLLRPGGAIIVADPVILENRAEGLMEGYMANSSIDGVIWRFTRESFVRHVLDVLPPQLTLSSVTCVRQRHVTNYNLFVPQTDLVATIEKRRA
jgi:SAM-dependent methyltransferase